MPLMQNLQRTKKDNGSRPVEEPFGCIRSDSFYIMLIVKEIALSRWAEEPDGASHY
jgi:hypothetical protein